MFCHIDSIKKFISFLQNWNSTTIVIIIVGVKGGGDSKGERKLLIVDGKSEFDQNVLALDNNFKTKYGQLFEAYNGGQYAMILINDATTSKEGWYLKS